MYVCKKMFVRSARAALALYCISWFFLPYHIRIVIRVPLIHSVILSKIPLLAEKKKGKGNDIKLDPPAW